MRTRSCTISFGRPWRLHPMSIDTLEFEPRAFRMRGGSDTTTPRAPGKTTAVHLHRATTAGEASRLWAQQEKSGPPVVQDDKTLLAVFENGSRDRNDPICTLSQNGYGDQRAKARKYMCWLTSWAVLPNTHPALCRLSSEVERDPAHSTQCGRQRPRWVEIERDPAHSTWYGRQRSGWVWVGPSLARAPQRFAKFL